jgi:hypothetical protein
LVLPLLFLVGEAVLLFGRLLASQAQRFSNESIPVTYTRSLNLGEGGPNLWDEAQLLGPQQDPKAPDHLDLVQASHFSSAKIIQKKAVSVQALVERHGFQLALAQTGNGDDKLSEVDRDDAGPQVGVEALRLRFARHGAFPEHGRRDANVLEKLIEKLKAIAGGECHECGGVRDDQHQ